MKKILSVILLIFIVAGLCVTCAWAENPPFPSATVGDVTGGPDLTFKMMFTADEVTDEQLAFYKDWPVDYILTVNKDVRGTDGYLAGSYELYNSGEWLILEDPTNDSVIIEANKGFGIMENTFGRFSYELIYNYVREFKCGVCFHNAFLQENPDLYVTLGLYMFNPTTGEPQRIGPLYEFGTRPAPVNPNPGTNSNPTPAAPAVQNIYYVPATADNSHMALWSILALGLLTTAFVTRKKKAEN